MSDEEIELCRDLECVRFFPGTSQKRFGKQMISIARYHPEIPLTPNQLAYLKLLHYRFRKQHGSVECAERPKAMQ